MYDALLQRYKEAKVASSIRPPTVHVIGRAKAPGAPYTPNIPMNMAIGAAAGILAAFGLVIAKDSSDHRLRTPGEAEGLLNIPELGVIPMAELLPKPQKAGLTLFGRADGNGEQKVELASWAQRMSRISESFRETMTSALALLGHVERPTVVLITSPVTGEGKTTVASNLAIVLAETGRRVLLIDGDMRRPQLQNVFNVPNNLGLSNLLRDNLATPDSHVDQLVRKTSVPGLYVLPSGPGVESYTSLLYSPKLSALMRRFRLEFDHVIVDTPPALACADARVLAQHADGVILVLRAGNTSRLMAQTALHRLHAGGIPVIGTILNQWRPVKNDEVYGYCYDVY